MEQVTPERLSRITGLVADDPLPFIHIMMPYGKLMVFMLHRNRRYRRWLGSDPMQNG